LEENNYFTYYTIERGDNLYEISRRYNINPKLLAAINGIKDNEYIYPGQELLIPKSGYSYYITAEGDTLSGVTEAFKTTHDNLLKFNKLAKKKPKFLCIISGLHEAIVKRPDGIYVIPITALKP